MFCKFISIKTVNFSVFYAFRRIYLTLNRFYLYVCLVKNNIKNLNP